MLPQEVQKFQHPHRKKRPSKLLILVDLVGIEPTTSSMPWKRAPKLRHRPTYKGNSPILSAGVGFVNCGWEPFMPRCPRRLGVASTGPRIGHQTVE